MEITENEMLDRWNDALKRATSCALEMVEFTALSDKKRSMWNNVAHCLDELRRRGNIMAQGRALASRELDRQLDMWETRIGKKTDAKVAKEKAEKFKKRIIIDG